MKVAKSNNRIYRLISPRSRLARLRCKSKRKNQKHFYRPWTRLIEDFSEKSQFSILINYKIFSKVLLSVRHVGKCKWYIFWSSRVRSKEKDKNFFMNVHFFIKAKNPKQKISAQNLSEVWRKFWANLGSKFSAFLAISCAANWNKSLAIASLTNKQTKKIF